MTMTYNWSSGAVTSLLTAKEADFCRVLDEANRDAPLELAVSDYGRLSLSAGWRRDGVTVRGDRVYVGVQTSEVSIALNDITVIEQPKEIP